MRFSGCAAAASLLLGLAPAAAADLAPHRIVYELRAAPGVAASGSVTGGGAAGRMVIEVVGGACEGYATRMRQVITIGGEGRPVTIDSSSATFEEPRGAGLHFRSETRTNGTTLEKVSGQAERARGDTVIAIAEPARKRHVAQGTVLFPTQQIERIISQAREGAPILEARLFDGGGNGSVVYDTLAVIGRPLAVAEDDDGVLAPLADLARWPVRISYFETGPGEPEPFFTLDMTLYENGIAGAVRLDYPELSLIGEVVALELLDPVRCGL